MSQANPRTVDALHRQMAHEAKHRTRKYDKNGRRKKESLPPQHERGQAWEARRRGWWG